mmetsp:Transcript_38134/g.92303  ORF Transcript_38134/g.92303 Transcript_38134/m.92303 type:complete len:327 (-) Transcript_38134:1773-2753(-)
MPPIESEDVLSVASDDSDKSWKRLSEGKREKLKIAGWNKRAWDRDDPTRMDFYNEVEYFWHQLPKDRQDYWIRRGYDEEKWEAEEDDQHDSLEIQGDAAAIPLLISLPLKDASTFDADYFDKFVEENDIDIEIKSGTDRVDDEGKVNQMKLRDFMQEFRKGRADHYLKFEDTDPGKEHFHNLGTTFTAAVHEAVLKQPEVANGLFKQEWHEKPNDFFNWSIWMGAAGSMTPMHFDTDLFNILYVVEGKKRVILIPNDIRTDGMFPIQKFYSGSAYTGVDILAKDYKLPEGSHEFIVEAGQGLIIPRRWWHAVENLEPTVAYGFRVV